MTSGSEILINISWLVVKLCDVRLTLPSKAVFLSMIISFECRIVFLEYVLTVAPIYRSRCLSSSCLFFSQPDGNLSLNKIEKVTPSFSFREMRQSSPPFFSGIEIPLGAKNIYDKISTVYSAFDSSSTRGIPIPCPP